jgi:hypothetical protein
MPPDDTLRPLYDYATALLQGVCRRPFSLGSLPSADGVVFLRAKLDPADLDELAYADAYAGMRAVLSRWGGIRQDATGQPFRIRFNFYDERNDDVAFEQPVAPAAPAQASAIAAAQPKRPRRTRAARKRRGTG